MRSGTLNVPGIVGLGAACEICADELEDENRRLASMRDQLEAAVTTELKNVRVNSPSQERLPHVWHVSFEGIDYTKLMAAIPDLAVSAAAACHTGSAKPSYVLKAIGLSDELALASLRISFGRFTTVEQAVYAQAHLIQGVRGLAIK
jgi:cysteine desulfurase